MGGGGTASWFSSIINRHGQYARIHELLTWKGACDEPMHPIQLLSARHRCLWVRTNGHAGVHLTKMPLSTPIHPRYHIGDAWI